MNASMFGFENNFWGKPEFAADSRISETVILICECPGNTQAGWSLP